MQSKEVNVTLSKTADRPTAAPSKNISPPYLRRNGRCRKSCYPRSTVLLSSATWSTVNWRTEESGDLWGSIFDLIRQAEDFEEPKHALARSKIPSLASLHVRCKLTDCQEYTMSKSVACSTLLPSRQGARAAAAQLRHELRAAQTLCS